ncbi:zinc knuckle [Ostertagia ostertagi]
MSSSLKGKQAWLSRQGNQLEEAISRVEESCKSVDTLSPSQAKAKIRKGIKELELRQTALETALNSFSSAADAANLAEENQERVQSNITAAHDIIIRAQNLSLALHLQLDEQESTKVVEAESSKAITAENYDLAVNLLQCRYGNEGAIIGHLLTALQSIRQPSPRLSDQRRILEKVTPLVSQLRQKGECVDTQHMKRTILGKFSEKIQRSVLKQLRHQGSDSNEQSWTTQQLLRCLQEYFDTEDMIQHAKGFSDENPRRNPNAVQPQKTSSASVRTTPQSNVGKYLCFYCHRADHRPSACTKFSTYAQRISEIHRQNLCQNCGSSTHQATSCPCGPCRSCGKKGHHTSICRISAQKESGPSQQRQEAKQKTQSAPKTPKKSTTTTSATTVIAQSSSCKLGQDTVLCKPACQPSNRGKADLLIGQARVWNTLSSEFEDVHIILDTGADRSFITTSYAKQLGLTTTGMLQLKIHTFGTNTPIEKSCAVTSIQIEDRAGKRHNFSVAVVDYIAGEIRRNPLDEADRNYLSEHNIKLSISDRDQAISPQILLGCGDLFVLLDQGFGHAHDLPSGLKALRSRIGYLITGCNRKMQEDSIVQLHALNTMQQMTLIIVRQLVPLELMDTPSQPSEDTMTEPSAPAAEEPEIQEEEQRYNLRKRPRVNYEQLHHGMISKTLFLLAFVTLLAPALSKPLGTSTKAGINTTADSIRCTTEGLFVTSNTLSLYELCVEGYCITRENPPPTETIHLSPEITLHPYAVKWKISKGQQLDTREIECPAIPFCSQVNCWFCTANILNPECHPQTAIITIAVVLYGIVALIYTICYVPVVVGLPIRVLLVITQRIFSMCFLAAYTCFSKLRVKLTRRAQPTKFIALLFIICIAHLAQSCQDVDVFELRATTCIRSGDGNRTCAVDITQMLKMNTFHRETCFRLLTRDTLLKEIRLEWKRLQLICDRQTVMFTRHVIQQVIDSKRCPRTGSCKGRKCASVNTTSLVPELSQGNKPRKNTIILQPTIPQNVGTMRITLSSVTVTPTPALQTWFITEGNNTARWTGSNIPTLECPSKKAAKVLDCEIHTNCRCQPAEDKMNCICTDTNITKDFNSELRNRLPLRYPWIEFEEFHPKEELNTVKAIPTRLSTAELLVTIREDYDSTVKEVTDTVCSVGDTTITGCYQCPHGALSEIVCFSQGESTMASVHCGENTFTVSCNNTGITSLLRFQLYQAQIHFQCEVYCGSTKTQFEITGLLHWTKTAYATGEKLLAGETSLYEEWALPDAEHIFSVLISWYKSILIVTIVLLLCIAVGYLFVWSCGTKTLQFAGYLVCISIRNTIRFGITLFIKTICCFNAVKESNQRSLRKEL